MNLTRLSLLGFRNLTEQELTFSPKINVIAGANGQGKTNLLESIYVLASSRSFRTHHTRELIQKSQDGFSVSGCTLAGGQSYELSVQWSEANKTRWVNGSRRDVYDYLGHFNAVVFSSIQMEQYRAESEHRRRLVDRGVCQLQPSHLKRMTDYSKVIKQKNSLLRDTPSLYTKSTYELLEVWDRQIAELGSKIIKARGLYIEKVREKSAVYRNQFNPDSLAIKYLAANEISSTADLANIQDQLSKRLIENRDQELRLRRCVTGPHRDELCIEIDGNPLNRFASAGQQRSALLTYSLAQMEVYFDAFQEYPVFLIDDFDSELDEARMNELLKVLSDKAQIFLTTTKPNLIRPHLLSGEAHTFFVQAGQVT